MIGVQSVIRWKNRKKYFCIALLHFYIALHPNAQVIIIGTEFFFHHLYIIIYVYVQSVVLLTAVNDSFQLYVGKMRLIWTQKCNQQQNNTIEIIATHTKIP